MRGPIGTGDGCRGSERVRVSEGEHTAPKDFGAFRDRLNQRFESLRPATCGESPGTRWASPPAWRFRRWPRPPAEMRVQPSTLVRFAKLFGFAGFSDMRELLRRRLLEAEDAFRERAPQGPGQDAGRRRGGSFGNSGCPVGCLGAGHRAAHGRCRSGRVERSASPHACGELHPCLRAGAAPNPWRPCLAQGLIGLHRRCLVLDANPGTLRDQVEAMTPAELMVAVAFEADSDPAIPAMSCGAGARRSRPGPHRCRAGPVFRPCQREHRGSLFGHRRRCPVGSVHRAGPGRSSSRWACQRPENQDPGTETL